MAAASHPYSPNQNTKLPSVCGPFTTSEASGPTTSTRIATIRLARVGASRSAMRLHLRVGASVRPRAPKVNMGTGLALTLPEGDGTVFMPPQERSLVDGGLLAARPGAAH